MASNRAPPLSGRFAAETRTRAASQPCRRGPLPSLCLEKKETSFPAIPAPKPRRFSVAARRCDQSAGASGDRVRISGLDSAADGAGAARPKRRTSNSPIRRGRAEEKKNQKRSPHATPRVGIRRPLALQKGARFSGPLAALWQLRGEWRKKPRAPRPTNSINAGQCLSNQRARSLFSLARSSSPLLLLLRPLLPLRLPPPPHRCRAPPSRTSPSTSPPALARESSGPLSSRPRRWQKVVAEALQWGTGA